MLLTLLLALLACHSKTPVQPSAVDSSSVDTPLDAGTSACGEEPWGGLEPGDGAIYVDDDASADGVGSLANPLASIGAALALAPAEILVEDGTYRESLSFPAESPGVAIYGTCSGSVTLIGSDDTVPVIDIDTPEGDFLVQGITVTGGLRGVRVQAGAVTLKDLNITDTTRVGLVAGAVDSTIEIPLELEDVAVSGVVPDPSEEAFGWGMQLATGVSASVRNVSIENVADRGLVIGPGAPEVSVDGIDVRGVYAVNDTAYGMMASEGAQIKGTTVSISDVDHFGLAVTGSGTSVDIASTSVTDIGLDGDGVGITAQDGADLHLVGVLVSDVEDIGILAYGLDDATEETTIEIENASVTEIQSDTYAYGAVAARGLAKINGSDIVISDSAAFGVHAIGSGASITLDGFEIGNITPSPVYPEGVGGLADVGGALTLRNGVVHDCIDNGLAGQYVAEDTFEPSTLSLYNVEVHHIEEDSSILYFSAGVSAINGATIVASDITIEDVPDLGFAISTTDDSILTSSGTIDSIDVSSVSDQNSNTGGTGLLVSDGGDLVASNVSVHDISGIGVSVIGHFIGSDVDVAGIDGTALSVVGDGSTLFVYGCDIQPPDLDGDFFPDVAGLSFDNASMTLDNCTVGRQSYIAFWASDGADLNLRSCEVQGAVPQDGYSYTVGYSNGATGSIVDSDLTDNFMVAVLAEDSDIDIDSTTIEGVTMTGVVEFATGVVAQGGGTVAASYLEVSGVEGPGLYSADDGIFYCETCAVHDNQFAGAAVDRATLLLEDSTITDTTAQSNLGGGVGVYATSEFLPSEVQMTNNVVEGNRYAAVWLDGPGTYEIWENELHGGEGAAIRDGVSTTVHGNAVVAVDGVVPWNDEDSTGCYLYDNDLLDSGHAAVLLDASSLSLLGNQWEDNSIDVVQQTCGDEGMVDLTSEPTDISTQICEGYDELVDDLYLSVILEDADVEE